MTATQSARPAQARLNAFFQWIWSRWVDGACDIDGFDVQEKLLEYRLVDAREYDPATDGDSDAEEGDIIYFLTDEVKALLP